MIAVRPKIRTRVHFTHYGLKLLIGGGTKGDDARRHNDGNEEGARKPEEALTETTSKEVKR